MMAAALLFGIPAFEPCAVAQVGVPLWTNRYHGAGSYDYPWALAISGSNVFVTGQSSNGTNDDYTTVAYASSGLPLWTNRYNGPTDGYDYARAIAIDSHGNVVVTGESFTGQNPDYATVAYSSAGIGLWTNRYDGPAQRNDSAFALAADSSGNMVVTGESSGIGFNPDYATVKYSGAGVPLWTNRYDSLANSVDTASAVAVDNSNNVFVSGYSLGIGTQYDYATVAYSSLGVPLWTNRYNGAGSGNDFVRGLALDNTGNVLVTGESVGINGDIDYATIKYSGAGVPLWTNYYNGSGNTNDYSRALGVDSHGNVFVLGHSFGNVGYDFVTVAYSSEGAGLWTNRFNMSGNTDAYAHGLTLDSQGNVFVTGASIASASSYDFVTVAYSGEGTALWTNSYNGPGNGYDFALAIAADKSGNVFVTGTSATSPSSYDFATIKYSPTLPLSFLLHFQKLNDQLVLSWTNAALNLQSAPAITAIFTNIPGATSPYTNSMAASQQYFRLKAF